MQEARYYKKLDSGRVRCRLCPQNCRIPSGRTGLCRARKNEDGVLYTLNYGKISSSGVDPIEKKPLYHFFPGSTILSVGTFGCNLECGFCQNWEIAHGEPMTEDVSPDDLVKIALEARRRSDSIGIAFTYSEPLIWYGYVYDTARLSHEQGLKNVLVTNGFIQREPLRELLPLIDAMNVDVKAFKDDFYHEICRGKLAPVMQTVETAQHAGCHVEITTLLVPGKNDGEEEITGLVDWIAALDAGLPLHFSRYFPRYHMDLPATPLQTILRAREIASSKLKYVYIGNVQELGADVNNTYCPDCRHLLVSRSGYRVTAPGLRDGQCTKCGTAAGIVTE